MNNIDYLKKQIKVLEKQLKVEANAETRKLLQAQKQAMKKALPAKTSTKKRSYHYHSAETKAKAQAKGIKLRMNISSEKKAEIEEKRKQGLAIYQEAQRKAKQDAYFKEYWKEVQKLRTEAKKLGKNLNLSNVSTSPTQIRNAGISPEQQARIALGLSSRIDVEILKSNAVGATVIEEVYDNDYNVIGYTYEGKGYSVAEMDMMLSSPKTFFAPHSKFWNWISNEYHTGVQVNEIFGS